MTGSECVKSPMKLRIPRKELYEKEIRELSIKNMCCFIIVGKGHMRLSQNLVLSRIGGKE